MAQAAVNCAQVQGESIIKGRDPHQRKRLSSKEENIIKGSVRRLSCTIMYHHVPSCTTMYHHVLSSTIMYHHVPSCTILYHHVPSCTIMYYPVPSCTLDPTQLYFFSAVREREMVAKEVYVKETI